MRARWRFPRGGADRTAAVRGGPGRRPGGRGPAAVAVTDSRGPRLPPPPPLPCNGPSLARPRAFGGGCWRLDPTRRVPDLPPLRPAGRTHTLTHTHAHTRTRAAAHALTHTRSLTRTRTRRRGGSGPGWRSAAEGGRRPRRVTFPAAGSEKGALAALFPRRHPPLRAVPAPGEGVPRAGAGMSCAGGSVVLPPAEQQRDPAAPLELPAGAGEKSGDTPEEGESGGPSSGEGRRGGSESGRAEAGATGGDKPETRSVCSSESGSGSHPGGAGPICKICFQGPEQVRRAGRAGSSPRSAPTKQPLTHTHTHTHTPCPAAEAAGPGGPAAGSDQHQGQSSSPPARLPPPFPRPPDPGRESGPSAAARCRGRPRGASHAGTAFLCNGGDVATASLSCGTRWL